MFYRSFCFDYLFIFDPCLLDSIGSVNQTSICGICRFWLISFTSPAKFREQMFDESSLVRASPLGLQRFVCRSWVAIVFIVSRLVPDYVILNFHAGRRREGDGVWLLSLNILRALWPSLCRNSSHNNSNANTKDSAVRRRFLGSAHLARRVSKLAGSNGCVVFRVFTGFEWGIAEGVHVVYSVMNVSVRWF